ncbi:MAG: phosphatase PAP2 family protein [Bacillota bacterium]
MSNAIFELNKTERNLISACIVFLAFFLLVTFFRTSFHSVDVEVNLWIPKIQSSALTYLAQGVAAIFDTTSLIIISLFISGVLFLKNHKAQGLLVLAAMGGDALIVSAIKNIEHVARPTNGIFLDTANFSYPSGHSAGVVVFAGVLAYFALRHWQNTRSKAMLGMGFGFIVGIVGFDRLYLNVHWVSDVLGGWLLGAFWLLFAVCVFRQLLVAGRLGSKRFSLVAMLLYVGAVVVAVFVVLHGLFGASLSF